LHFERKQKATYDDDDDKKMKDVVNRYVIAAVRGREVKITIIA
jgi:hypothetical protein